MNNELEAWKLVHEAYQVLLTTPATVEAANKAEELLRQALAQQQDGRREAEHCTDCDNRSQCWESCGDLGHSKEHAVLHEPTSEAIENLKAVLCDPEGKCCIRGSDADRKIVDEALEQLSNPPAPDLASDVPLSSAEEREHEAVIRKALIASAYMAAAEVVKHSRGAGHAVQGIKDLTPADAKAALRKHDEELGMAIGTEILNQCGDIAIGVVELRAIVVAEIERGN